MKNSFKFIYVISGILVIILVVSLGIFVMNNSVDYIGTVGISSTEVEEFNTIWKPFEGLLKGSTLKTLLLRMKTNATENADNPVKLVDLAYNISEGSDFTIIESTVKETNAEAFYSLQQEFDVKHAYIVEFIYNEKNGIITGILIKAGRNDKLEFVPNEN